MKLSLLTLLTFFIIGGYAMAAEKETKSVVLAGGCFWCLEPPYDNAEGVKKTTVGYIGGKKETANYEAVSEGNTGHREAIKVEYDPKVIAYEALLEIFWKNIDPADAKGQYADRGFQYTTAIYAADETERKLAESSKAGWERKSEKPVATVIEDAKEFYPAEDYHQEYYKKNEVRYNVYKHSSGRK
jgi:peptide-methionine (S)-S-oxide reductase